MRPVVHLQRPRDAVELDVARSGLDQAAFTLCGLAKRSIEGSRDRLTLERRDVTCPRCWGRASRPG